MFFFIVGLLSSCNGSDANDYDKICKVFTEYEKTPESFSDDPHMKAYQISKKVHKILSEGEVKEMWKVVANIDPEKKYQFIQTAARASLKNKWECLAMKRYFLASLK